MLQLAGVLALIGIVRLAFVDNRHPQISAVCLFVFLVCIAATPALWDTSLPHDSLPDPPSQTPPPTTLVNPPELPPDKITYIIARCADICSRRGIGRRAFDGRRARKSAPVKDPDRNFADDRAHADPFRTRENRSDALFRWLSDLGAEGRSGDDATPTPKGSRQSFPRGRICSRTGKPFRCARRKAPAWQWRGSALRTTRDRKDPDGNVSRSGRRGPGSWTPTVDALVLVECWKKALRRVSDGRPGRIPAEPYSTFSQA